MQQLTGTPTTTLRTLSNATVQDAVTMINATHTAFGVTPPPMATPTQEPDIDYTAHEQNMLNTYYFHPDHLGSSSYITNSAGMVSQHMEYMPFGETLVDEHLNSNNSPFKFNGKEFDEETGNYYYSARYYDPKLSIFISVDPLAEKTMSAYGYCYNNPIKFIDPTGMWGEVYSTTGEHLKHIDDGTDKMYVVQANKVFTRTDGYKQWSAKDQIEVVGLTHQQYLDRANWIYAEGGCEIAEYYAYTIENAFLDNDIGKNKESLVYYWLMADETGKLEKDKYLSGGYKNQTGKKFWDLRNTPDKFDQDMQNSIAAVIKSRIFPEGDPTGETNAWLGYDDAKKHIGEYFIQSKGSKHFFQKYGESGDISTERKYITIPYPWETKK